MPSRSGARDAFERLREAHGTPGVPARGFCVATGYGGYTCFEKRVHAKRAAQLLADGWELRVDLVQVQGHGEDRFIVGQFEPATWR